MLPDCLLSYPYEDYRINLSNNLHSVGLVLHKNFLWTFYLFQDGLKEYLLLCIT